MEKEFQQKYPDYESTTLKKLRQKDLDIKAQLLTPKQMFYSIVSYIATTLVLLLLVKLTQHIPGADIAANFLNDK